MLLSGIVPTSCNTEVTVTATTIILFKWDKSAKNTSGAT